MKKLKKISALVGLFSLCGLFGLSLFLLDHKKEQVQVNAVEQVFTTYDSGNVDTTIRYYPTTPQNSNEVTLSFKYRFVLLARDNGNNTYSFKPKITLTYNLCNVTDLNFRIYKRGYAVGQESFSYEGTWVDSITDDARFYLTAIQDYDSSTLSCNMYYDFTNTIQGDYWETWNSAVEFFDYYEIVAETLTIYDYISFPYNNGSNKILLFDETSNLSQISLLDIYYQQGYQQGYSQGYADGEIYGESTTHQSSYNEGYSVGSYEGYQQGYQQGINDGSFGSDQYYNNGYQAGYNDGYSVGFNSDATASSIFSGILQVALVPINFFLACFNFEILGINLKSFIQALITVVLTIIVVRTIFGGKGGND